MSYIKYETWDWHEVEDFPPSFYPDIYYLICWLSVDVSSFLEMKIDGAYQS